MKTQINFMQAWENTIETVRETLSQEFNNPNFRLDANSSDSKYALAVILENDFVDDVLTKREKEAFINAYHGFNDVSGKSSLGFSYKTDNWIGHDGMRIVNRAKDILRDEIMLMKRPIYANQNTKQALELEAC